VTFRQVVGKRMYGVLVSFGYVKLRKRLSPIKALVVEYVKNFLIFIGLERLLLTRVVEIAPHGDPIDGVTEYQVLFKGEEMKFDDERYYHYLRRSPLFGDCTYRQRDVFVCTIGNAKLDMKTGVICTKDNMLLAESAMEVGRLKISGSYRSFVPRAKILSGAYATIWGIWGRQHYHWWIDCLSRIYSLKKAGLEDFELLMPDDLKPYQKESLSYCLPDKMRVRYLAERNWIQVKSVIFPSFVTWKACGFIPQAHLSYLRERIFEALDVTHDHKYSNRIYISRSGIHRRRVLNEAELIEYLAQFGFKIYQPETLTLEEQVRLFHDADMVVAPHGSALVNLLFSGKIKVLEIFPIATPEPHFFFLSQCLGQKYYYQFHNQKSLHDDFLVDMGEFRRAFSRVMSVR